MLRYAKGWGTSPPIHRGLLGRVALLCPAMALVGASATRAKNLLP